MSILRVQTSTIGYFNGTDAAATVFSNPPTPHNAITFILLGLDSAEQSGTFSVTDPATSNTYSIDVNNVHTFGRIAGLNGSAFDIGANAGNPLTLNAVYSGSTGINGGIIAVEWSGLAAFDKYATAVNTSSTTPAAGPTAALSGTESIAIGSVIATSTLAGATAPPSGYTDLWQSLAGTDGTFGDIGFLHITGSNAAQRVNWGTTSSPSFWVATLATYLASTPASYQPQLTLLGA